MFAAMVLVVMLGDIVVVVGVTTTAVPKRSQLALRSAAEQLGSMSDRGDSLLAAWIQRCASARSLAR